MTVNTILPVVVGALVAFVLYDMFVKDLLAKDAFDSDL